MRTSFPSFLVIFTFLLISNFSIAQNDYFFPQGSSFDPDIPTPESFLGYSIGDFHTRIDRMVAYMEHLAEVSDKANFEIIGYTNERRPQIVLTITNPDNYNQLETIREAHLEMTQGARTVEGLEDHQKRRKGCTHY